MRIHVSEADEYGGALLYSAILELLRERGYAGATVFRGAMSFGADSVVHTDSIEVMALDLPIVIECVESDEKIAAILPELDGMIDGGLITLERADVMIYRPHDSAAASI